MFSEYTMLAKLSIWLVPFNNYYLKHIELESWALEHKCIII